MIYTQYLVNECSMIWSVIIFSLHQMPLGWQSRKNKLSKACRMGGKYERLEERFGPNSDKIITLVRKKCKYEDNIKYFIKQ